MRFYVVTIFPSMFDSFASHGLVGKALSSSRLELTCISPRDFVEGRHRSVDDAPYGGGLGMVMMVGPIVAALESIAERESSHGEKPHRVHLTPQGAPFTQSHAQRYAKLPSLALVCGRYEGVDERIEEHVDEEVSLGDFVMTGGETAAMCVIDAAARLLPGVLGNEASPVEESHSQGVLEYPQYTRPPEFRGATVPEVLLSGNHAQIERWRRLQSLIRTRDRRPDLFAKLELSESDRRLLAHAANPKDEG